MKDQHSKTTKAYLERLAANRKRAAASQKPSLDFFEANRLRLIAPENLDKDTLGVMPDDVLPFMAGIEHPLIPGWPSEVNPNEAFLHTFMLGEKPIGMLYANDNWFVPRLGIEPEDVVFVMYGRNIFPLRLSYAEFITLMRDLGCASISDDKVRQFLLDTSTQLDQFEISMGIPSGRRANKGHE